MKFTNTIGILMLFSLGYCKVAEKEAKYNLNVQSFECLGNCPVYSFSIDSLRVLRFNGLNHSKEGMHQFRLTKYEYGRLVTVLKDNIKEEKEGSLIAGTLDSSNKEIHVINANTNLVLRVEKNNPSSMKLDSLLNQILKTRSLIND